MNPWARNVGPTLSQRFQPHANVGPPTLHAYLVYSGHNSQGLALAWVSPFLENNEATKMAAGSVSLVTSSMRPLLLRGNACCMLESFKQTAISSGTKAWRGLIAKDQSEMENLTSLALTPLPSPRAHSIRRQCDILLCYRSDKSLQSSICFFSGLHSGLVGSIKKTQLTIAMCCSVNIVSRGLGSGFLGERAQLCMVIHRR